MGILSNLITEKRSNEPVDYIDKPTGWLQGLVNANKSKSGIAVNEENALKIMAVFVCVNLISNAIACLPKPVYRSKSKGTEKARDHPLWNIINMGANPEMTAFDFWKSIMVNVLISKGGFAEIVRDESGAVKELWPIPGQFVMPMRNKRTGELYLSVSYPEKDIYTNLYPGQYLYIKGFSKDGIYCYEPVRIAREAMGLSTALEQFGEEFFANGANAGGIVEYPGAMSDGAFERYKSSFRDSYQGLGKSNRIIFLEQGAKYTQLTVPPNAGQFLESRKFQTTEICRHFSVPPHKAFEYENVNYNTAEQANIEFVQTTLTPWCTNIEQAIWLYLFLSNEQKKMYVKNNLNGLLRGDFQTRMQGYHWMRQDGVYSANDIREMEDMEPIMEEEGGNLYLINGNMVPITMAGAFQKKGGNNNAGQKNTGPAAKGDTQQQP